MVTKIDHAVFVTDKLESNKSLYLKDGVITAFTDAELPYDRRIDARGLYVAPGFVDIHTHGAGNYDFADGSVEDILQAARAHSQYGTTTIFPTCTSSSAEDIRRFICNVRAAMDQNQPGRPYIAGSHLEGPYFSQTMRGAQNPAYLKFPQREEYEQWVSLGQGSVRRISFAPELPGSVELCDFLAEKGIVAAFGHTDGVYEELAPCIQRGCRLATHLYSGMNTVTRRGLYRKLGAVETAFLEQDVTVEVIADGIHLPPALLRLIYQIKGPEKICLVTDSMRGAGMGDGPSVLGPKHDGMDCEICNGVANLMDMSAFAGSVATADRLVRVMYQKVGIPLTDCIRMMCRTSAEVMGLTDRGQIKEGYQADLVFFNEDIRIQRVLMQGMEIKQS